MLKGFLVRIISKIISKVDSFIFGLSLISLPRSNRAEDNLIEELRRDIPAAAKIDTNINRKDGSRIDISWTKRLSDMIMKDDPRRFLSWDVIRETMYIGHAFYIYKELRYLKMSKDWDTCWRRIIKEDKTGFPGRYMRYVKGVNNNTIHQIYHLARFQESTGVSIKEMDLIIEFGGGYGNICSIIHRLGFRGRYIIYDLPAVSSLQRYYLGSNSIRVIRNPEEFRDSNNGTWCVSELDILSKIGSDSAKTLFIATWSISEVDLDLRHKFLSMPLINKTKNYLIAYSNEFGGIDNLKFFREWSGSKRDIIWSHLKIPHLLAENYTFGHI